MYIKKIPETKVSIDCFYTYYHSYRKPKHIFSGQRHNFWEINIILNGNMILTCDDKIINLSKNQMYFIPPNKFHKYTIPKEYTEYIVLTFDADIHPDDSVYTVSEKNLNLVEMIIEEMDSKNPDGKFNTENTTAPQTLKLLTELLINRAISHDAVPYTKTEYSDVYEKAVNFMKANIFEKISSNDIARHCRISNSSLKIIFKKHTDIGVMHYYNGLKMEYAKKMLLDGHSVNSIAEELNFSSQAYFSSAFKQYAGMSPLSFKKNNKTQ